MLTNKQNLYHAYQLGYNNALTPNNNPFNDCPYNINQEEYDEWWKGYGDGSIELIIKENLST